MIRMRLMLMVLIFALGACAPAATPTPTPPSPPAPPPTRPVSAPPPSPSPELRAALERFPIKDDQSWQLTAIAPDGPGVQRFALRLSGGIADSDGLLFAQGAAGALQASLVFNPKDGALLIAVITGEERDPSTTACTFSAALAGRATYQGRGFVGRLSELERLNQLPASRFGPCTLQRL